MKNLYDEQAKRDDQRDLQDMDDETAAEIAAEEGIVNTCPNCGSRDIGNPYNLGPDKPVFRCGECEVRWTDETRNEVVAPFDTPANYQTELNRPLG